MSSLIKTDAWFGFCFSLSLHYFFFRFAEFPNWQNEEAARFHFDEYTLTHTHTRTITQFAILLKFKHQKPILVCACARVFCCWSYLIKPNQAILYIHTSQLTYIKQLTLRLRMILDIHIHFIVWINAFDIDTIEIVKYVLFWQSTNSSQLDMHSVLLMILSLFFFGSGSGIYEHHGNISKVIS